MLIRGEKPLTEQSGFFKGFLRYFRQKSRVFWCFWGQKVPKNPKNYDKREILFMRLQILVPQYHEDEKVIKNLLDSISIQRVENFDDFEVIIVSDGGDVILSEDFLNKYPFNIKYIIAVNKATLKCRLSTTRQCN